MFGAKRSSELSGERSTSPGLGLECPNVPVRLIRMIYYFSFFFIFRATTEGFVLCWGFPQSCPKLVPADR